MESFEVIEKKATGLLKGGGVKDLIMLQDSVFNLLWDLLQKRRIESRAAKVESIIEKSSIADLLELPEDLFAQLGNRLKHVRANARVDNERAEQDRLKRERSAIPRIIK